MDIWLGRMRRKESNCRDTITNRPGRDQPLGLVFVEKEKLVKVEFFVFQ